MDPEDLKQAWRTQLSQTRLTMDSDLLLQEVRRNHQYFNAMILWRDVREVGVSLLMLPVWLYMGRRLSLPWTWYLAVPAFLWIAGYMLINRRLHTSIPPQLGEPLCQHLKSSLAQVEQQIELLRTVLWWYLLPLALPIMAFFGQVSWQMRLFGWLPAVVFFVLLVAIMAVVFAAVYRLNLFAIRSQLEPRRMELNALLSSLEDEATTPVDH